VAPVLTPEQIEAVVNALPVQGRIMLRLLLLQYLDVTREDVEYMAADRPDPRFHAGEKPATPYISQETVQGITDRVAQYRRRIRQRRERIWLQLQCLRTQIALSESLCALSERLLTSRFGMNEEEIQAVKQRAHTDIPKTAVRELERKWQADEITEADCQKERLRVEFQTQLRRLERQHKRLDIATRELEACNSVPIQDHEIGHIWGIPAGSLAGRKAKYLHQYLQGLQGAYGQAMGLTDAARTSPIDLWKETFVALSRRPVERSVAVYDGFGGSEAALVEKLTAFAAGTFPEDQESRFWLSLVQESRTNAEYGDRTRSLFPLQRLSAILAEMDRSPEALEQELINRISPKPKVATVEPKEETTPSEPELGQLGEHVLRSFVGEDRKL